MSDNTKITLSELTISDIIGLNDTDEFTVHFDSVTKFASIFLDNWTVSHIESITKYAKNVMTKSGLLAFALLSIPTELSITQTLTQWVGFISFLILCIYLSIYIVMRAIESPTELLDIDSNSRLLSQFVLVGLLGTAYYANKNSYARLVWRLLFRDAPYSSTGETISKPSYIDKVYSIRNRLIGFLSVVVGIDIIIQVQDSQTGIGSLPDFTLTDQFIQSSLSDLSQIELVVLYIIIFITAVGVAFLLSVMNQLR